MSYGTSTSTACTRGPWKLDRVYAATQRAYVRTERPHSRGLPIAAVVGECDGEHVANARLIAAAPELRATSQRFYDAVQDYLHVPDSALPTELVEAMNALEAAWHKSDGTPPEA
jgi:hypothetical protein